MNRYQVLAAAETAVKDREGSYGSPQLAAENLGRAGIPGLKYYDEMSRILARSNPSRNYVTWDQDVLDRMRLLERDGERMFAGRNAATAEE